MAFYLNKFELAGNVTKKNEVKTTSTNKKFSECSIAVETGWGNNKKTSFYNIIMFDKQVEFFDKYIEVGDNIYINGVIEMDSWMDRNSNKKIYREKKIANEVKIVAKSKKNKENSESNNNVNNQSNNPIKQEQYRGYHPNPMPNYGEIKEHTENELEEYEDGCREEPYDNEAVPF